MNSRRLKRWDITSRRRLAELKAFAWQYKEWVAALEEITDLPAVENDGMPHGTSIGDPVARIAEAREAYTFKINLVDTCIRFCAMDDNLRSAVFRSVTTPGGISYNRLKQQGRLNYERDAYYEAVHKFYWHLDQLKI